MSFIYFNSFYFFECSFLRVKPMLQGKRVKKRSNILKEWQLANKYLTAEGSQCRINYNSGLYGHKTTNSIGHELHSLIHDRSYIPIFCLSWDKNPQITPFTHNHSLSKQVTCNWSINFKNNSSIILTIKKYKYKKLETPVIHEIPQVK